MGNSSFGPNNLHHGAAARVASSDFIFAGTTLAKTFVGIGFGPIQSGLFLLEAATSGNFDRLVVAEVVPETVLAVRQGCGRYWVNIAEAQGIRSQQITGVEIYNPLDAADTTRLLAAISAADEIATALPNVDFFERGAPSPADLLARGLCRKLVSRDLPSTVVYAAENHNRAAELLRDAVQSRLKPAERSGLADRVQFVNTVIGKMSGVVTDWRQIERDRLVPLVEGGSQAVLVEQFNRILISQIKLPDFERGIDVFQEKLELLPFEEAKLYGHNAAHALLGYLANRQRIEFIHEVDPAGLLRFVEQTFDQESGGALCRRHAGLDPLFTPAGWADYVRDLLLRMVNPYLRDRVDRVIRDPRRKLGWDDRLVGTMCLLLAHGIEPRRYALGAAAAVELLLAEQPGKSVADVLEIAWGESDASPDDRCSIIDWIERARKEL
jgi:mannitol-1-phosphate 5-dehydrogenase